MGARYGAICQENGLVPIIEPEGLLDGEHDIDTTYAVALRTWSAVFKAMADYGVDNEAILLKPSMVTPGADAAKKEDPETVAKYTLNLNAMNQEPIPWHVSFSYARALQNTVLKT